MNLYYYYFTDKGTEVWKFILFAKGHTTSRSGAKTQCRQSGSESGMFSLVRMGTELMLTGTK